MNKLRILLSVILILNAIAFAQAQAMYIDSARVLEEPSDSATIIEVAEPAWPLLTNYTTVDEYMAATDSFPYSQLVSSRPLPRVLFMPAVFTSFEYSTAYEPFTPDYSGNEALRWIEEEQATARATERINRHLFYSHPEVVQRNIRFLPEAPQRYQTEVRPEEHTVAINNLPAVDAASATVSAAPVKEKHWLHTFNASLQFSQAYVSPNWYQGGDNNLNALANVFYNVKLNQAYHPDVLFEMTAQYKLGMNNAPDDKYRDYNITDDLLQLSGTFGYKAARRWYYSLNLLFKTQLFHSYGSNSETLHSAFLSPGELNIGLGMTYNYTNEPKTITFDASIAPLSYNLKICTNSDVNETKYEIDEGKITRSKVGSSTELKFSWKLAHNISYKSRLFAFTDYSNAYADWEHTLAFEINRFLTTQIYAHMRYDSATPTCDDPSWKKLQIKEIFSIGFAYKFSSI